jgi:hypothetical protein
MEFDLHYLLVEAAIPLPAIEFDFGQFRHRAK